MPEGTLHLAVVLAKREHARIRALDTAEAQAMPGVVNVVTAKDVKGTNRLVAPQGTVHSLCDGLDRPVICDGVVRRYGDVVAVVAATGRDKARPRGTGPGGIRAAPAVMTFMEAARKGRSRSMKTPPTSIWNSRLQGRGHARAFGTCRPYG